MKALKKELKEKKEFINIVLDRFLPRKDEYPKNIHKAMRHTLFIGGKRFRSYLTIKVFSLFAEDKENLKLIGDLAASLELIHTYSLIHDDLPPIDNDDYRRGRKSCHKVYGENIALLAGNALQVYAFDILAQLDIDAEKKILIISEFSKAIGADGLIGGQFIDIESEGKKIDKKTLHYIHYNKTAALIILSVKLACYLAEAQEEDIKKMLVYGENLGLAFQIIDDILDIEGTFEDLGKSIGKDEKSEKATYPSLFGLEEAKNIVQDMRQKCLKILEEYGIRAKDLIEMTEYIFDRKI